MLMTNQPPERNDTPESFRPFETVVTPLLTDLLYPSESDEPIEPVTCYLDQADPLSASQITDWLMQPPAVYVEERPEADFWQPVTAEQDWYGDDEKRRTARFQHLQQTVETLLTTRQFFRVGQTEIELYLIGRQANGERAGLKTNVIET